LTVIYKYNTAHQLLHTVKSTCRSLTTV